MNTKLKIYSLFLFLILTSCNSKGRDYTYSQGEVFATYYRFQIDSDKDFSKQIDSIFRTIDNGINSYVDYSEISKFNREGILENPSPTFIEILQKARYYNQSSQGYFEPTLYPLINAWGFGLKNKEQMDSIKVDSLLKLVSFNKFLMFNTNKVQATKKGVKIDLSAMGEGYALDAVASILDKSNVKNYMVEIGGEMKTKGVNPNGKIWQVGIENPNASISKRSDALVDVVTLENKGLSTSGNYRKFYTDSLGNKYAHIISPKNGYPIKHNLLSVSIISNSSTTSDVLATACMAMGTQKSMFFIEKNPNIEGILIYSERGKMKTWKSKGFLEIIKHK